jgi:transposase-like protein
MQQLSELTLAQRIQLQAHLTHPTDAQRTVALLEEHTHTQPACGHCGSAAIQRWGHSDGLQRYRCKTCRRTFNTLTGTPLARLRHKEKWLAYEHALLTGMSVRAAAAHCAIAKNTSFKWRHRFLQRPAHQQAHQMQGVAEADETFFAQSCKGQRQLGRLPRRRGGKGARHAERVKHIPVLVVRDRHGATADFPLAGTSTHDIAPVLTPLLMPDVILCTDGAFAYRRIAQRQGWSHHAVNLARQIYTRGPYHIQNVNAYHSRLKGWMARFHGVATRYLTHYLGWRRMLEHFGPSLSPEVALQAALYVKRPGQQVTVT